MRVCVYVCGFVNKCFFNCIHFKLNQCRNGYFEYPKTVMILTG